MTNLTVLQGGNINEFKHTGVFYNDKEVNVLTIVAIIVNTGSYIIQGYEKEFIEKNFPSQFSHIEELVESIKINNEVLHEEYALHNLDIGELLIKIEQRDIPIESFLKVVK